MSTREEWRELGFYYDRVDESRVWRIVGSRSGLARFVSLLEQYVLDPRNTALSEHEHYGPYMYLKITTWSAAEISDDGIRGSLDDLRRLRDLVQARLSTATVGDHFVIGREYSERVAYSLRFELREEGFDPASEDA